MILPLMETSGASHRSILRGRAAGEEGARAANGAWAALVSDHFNTPLISLNSVLSPVPRLVSATTSAIARNAAIKAYSIAVAPLSLLRKFLKLFVMIQTSLQS
jgi:hypothetical protein